MITNPETWAELARKYRIQVEGHWRKSVTMRPGRRIEAQVFSSSSLEHVHAIGAFSIIRNGALIGAAVSVRLDRSAAR